MDRQTAKWIRGRGDELAAANGCKFEEKRGRFVVDWIEKYCRLYEGVAGEPMELRDWQREATMRIFGWVRWSEKWKRWIRRFRQASIWVPKKNKKSPTLAAWALYLLCGDGEPGQKVFLAAKDGTQAREIAGKHVLEMLYQSPELMHECRVNLNLMQVTHTETRSTLRPLSSSNSRTQESKEGLNGSVLIDETHVVDREFVARISRAGISRMEPLLLEVSTAGNNPDGYGKERFDYACKVERGEVVNQEFFPLIYAAPQDLKDSDLDADPLKWGRVANPAMGHTVDPEEFLSDYQNSKTSLYNLGLFKMYRLNIWQKSASPWIRGSDWDLCEIAFTEEDLEGQECYAGLDLSKTRDMSALVLIFPQEDESFKVLPFFWLPESYARENSHLVPFMEWAAAGHLTLTPGDVIDYGFIRSQVRRLAERFNIVAMAYDQKYAEETTQAIEQGVMDDEGNEIEAGTGIERVVFPQTLMNFCGPTAEWERLVISHKLHHNGHPVLSWQAGHVQVKGDANNNKRPVKPPQGDIKKIDGIIAGIQGLAIAKERAGMREPDLIVL